MPEKQSVSSKLVLSAIASFLCANSALVTTSAHAFVLKTTEDGSPVRWDTDTIPMRIATGAPCGPSDGEIRAAMEIAVEAWRVDLTVPDVVIASGSPPTSYGYVAPYEDGNGVYVLCSWPFEAALAVTVATHDPDGRMVDADIVINGRQMLALLEEGAPPTNEHDLASVLTHEMGHVLGLDESDRPAATMWPTTMTADIRQRTLANDDEAGVLALYEDANIRLASYGCTASTLGGSRSPASGAPFAFALAIIIWRRTAG